MNVLEIPVIGNRDSEKEKIYTLLSDMPLRNFLGLDFGLLNLDEEIALYFYFLNQENENYLYLWDIIIPHAIGCILICNWRDPQSIEENLKTIEYIEQRFSTPLHICSLPTDEELPNDIIKEELEQSGDRKSYLFDPKSKKSVKDILTRVISI
jgi:hypothetical protein